MLPETLHDFLVASVGASASFIGLLFVALTFVLARSNNAASFERRDKVLAESSYMALVSILFISLVGLLPGGGVSWVLCIMGLIGSLLTVRSAKDKEGRYYLRLLLFVVYGFMTVYGFLLITHIVHHLSLSAFYTVMFTLYGIALGRAWALTGVEF